MPSTAASPRSWSTCAPGVEVRPLFQATGEAEFNECFFVDARVPDSQRLGCRRGLGVSITTLMNERVSIGARCRGAFGLDRRSGEDLEQTLERS